MGEHQVGGVGERDQDDEDTDGDERAPGRVREAPEVLLVDRNDSRPYLLVGGGVFRCDLPGDRFEFGLGLRELDAVPDAADDAQRSRVARLLSEAGDL